MTMLQVWQSGIGFSSDEVRLCWETVTLKRQTYPMPAVHPMSKIPLQKK